MANAELEVLEAEMRSLFTSNSGERMDKEQKAEVERVIRAAFKLGVKAAFGGFQND